MTRLIAAAALALLAGAVSAQTEEVHTFEVRDGHVYLDGRHLADAVPDGVDLTGFTMTPLEFSGPIQPVLEIDGTAYVLEGERLMRLEDSRRPDRGVYILGDVSPEAVADMPEERVTPIVEAAYMREVAAQNEALYTRMRRERAAEDEVMTLAARVRSMPDGAERDRGRARLRALLSDLLSLKHEIRAEEIAAAQDRIEAARRGLADRLSHHEDIVDSRLRELIGEE